MAHLVIQTPAAAREFQRLVQELPARLGDAPLNGFDLIRLASLGDALGVAAGRTLMPQRITGLGPSTAKLVERLLAEALLREYPEDGSAPAADRSITLNVTLVADEGEGAPPERVTLAKVLQKHGLRDEGEPLVP